MLLILNLIFLPAAASAKANIFTFLEGQMLEKRADEWIISTKDGIYWIEIYRPVSWLRKLSSGKVSFWVRTDQIKRFRPPAVD